FSSESHPQFTSHEVTLRHHNVVPVILGHSLPRHGTENCQDNEYYQYLLLLLMPWRSLPDLRPDGTTWQAVYEATQFSPYCESLIRNMHVNAECRDAK
ncbi:hypothetical protein EV363DRAFT_1122292, partial [Boletus edulis]